MAPDSPVPLSSRLILWSLAEYFFQRAGGVCSLRRHPLTWWGWCVLRPVLHREWPGRPPGAGRRAVQYGESTQWVLGPGLCVQAELSMLWMPVLTVKPVPLHDDTCRHMHGRGWPGGLWWMQIASALKGSEKAFITVIVWFLLHAHWPGSSIAIPFPFNGGGN